MGIRAMEHKVKGQKIFHTGYEPREVDKHDMKNIEKLMSSVSQSGFMHEYKG
ncbi:nucleotidyltransferase domain-containing protein [Hungatella sp.]|uniref:nucleotidyltransferase domain-containing protein n=1 Tax=Hungatella sp. TaxID=2613924 RepID=UPI003AB5D13C